MSTIYVRTTGNDTTGTGLTGAPYATLNKALLVAAAGDTILLGDGTYAENTSSGFLNVPQNFSSSRVTVAPETGRPDKVIVQGTGTTWVLVLGGANNIHFDNMTFEAQASTVTAPLRLNSATNVRFSRCVFRTVTASGSNPIGVSAAGLGSATLSGITFDDCRFEQVGHYAAAGILIDNTTGTATVTDIRVLGCTFSGGYYGVRIIGATNVRIQGNRLSCWSPTVGVHALQLGVDGPSGALTNGVVTGNTCRTLNGHAGVIGAGCNGVLVAGNHFYGGENAGVGQGLVVKEAQNVRVERNVITSGYLSGLYFKGAVDCQAFDNVIYNQHATSAALKIGVNSETSNACQRLTVRRNYFHATLGTIFSIGTASDDSGGSVVDENVYAITGSATLGSIRGNAVTKLTEVRAAWSGYDRPVNDRNSRLGQTRGVFAGSPFVDLPA